MQVQSLGWQDLLEVGMATTPVFSPIKSHEQRSLVGYCPWKRRESDRTEAIEHTHMLIKNHDIYLKALYSNSLNNCCYTMGYLKSGVRKN